MQRFFKTFMERTKCHDLVCLFVNSTFVGSIYAYLICPSLVYMDLQTCLLPVEDSRLKQCSCIGVAEFIKGPLKPNLYVLVG